MQNPTPALQPTNHSKPKLPLLLSLCLCLFLSISATLAITYFFLTPKIAYVNTGKLIIGFSEANKIEKEVKAEDDKWQAQYKSFGDSLQATIDGMSKEYNTAKPARKKELQDMLSARNQQINNFRQANVRKIQDMRQKRMETVFEKINIYISEYGKKHNYTMIFGTVAGGSILYGNERTCDKTEDIIKGLNERYK